MRLKEHKTGFYEKYIKRFFDIVLSASALMILSPLLLVLALLVKFKLGSPVIFKQERPGKQGRVFTLYKFRTMVNAFGQDGRPLPDGERLTPFGKKLRSTSLDELPELFNIIKGDMSIIGPRPLITSYLPKYNDEQKRRHDVIPGLTGWAQVNGRNALSWEDRFVLDIEYVDHISFKFDVKIFLMTIEAVLKKEGISSTTSETMEEFEGTPSNN